MPWAAWYIHGQLPRATKPSHVRDERLSVVAPKKQQEEVVKCEHMMAPNGPSGLTIGGLDATFDEERITLRSILALSGLGLAITRPNIVTFKG